MEGHVLSNDLGSVLWDANQASSDPTEHVFDLDICFFSITRRTLNLQSVCHPRAFYVFRQLSSPALSDSRAPYSHLSYFQLEVSVVCMVECHLKSLLSRCMVWRRSRCLQQSRSTLSKSSGHDLRRHSVKLSKTVLRSGPCSSQFGIQCISTLLMRPTAAARLSFPWAK